MAAKGEAFHVAHGRVLEQIARGAPLPEVLEAIVRLIEGQARGMLCSILRFDERDQTLHYGAAPNLPAAYNQAIEGATIGPQAGSCGAAAFSREPVIVSDIATHPCWAEYRHLALPHGLQACWSTPILSPDQKLLGTFAMYYREVRSPGPDERALVATATHLAAIAFLRDQAENRLHASRARAEQLAHLYAVSSRVNETIVRFQSPQELYEEACRIAVEEGLAPLAWVGLYREAEDLIEPVARFGNHDGYLTAIALRLRDHEIGQGPAARSIRTGQVTVSNDLASDPTFYWKDEAIRRGFRACAVFPFRAGPRTLGVLVIYGDSAGFFQDEEVRVLSALADHITFAVESAATREQGHRLEENLRQAQKMEAVGRLAGGLAHDFNNLLSVILGISEMILRTEDANHPLRPEIDDIRKAGERAATLTRQLLAFSRRQVLQPRAMDLNQVVTGLEKLLARLIGDDVSMSIRPGPDLGPVLADPGQIEQVVMNLVVNARQAMPGGGTLTLETACLDLDAAYAAAHPDVTPGPYVMLAVTDTGSGMDAATQARIFEPFFTTKEPGQGTGLGLSTVYGIVTQSGGSIEVRSQPGAGTTFRVFLPRVSPQQEAHPPEPRRPASLRGNETILLVEDQDQVRSVARTILQHGGYTVLDAQNGGEAFLICEQHKGEIHLLLSDVIMPRLSGPELAGRVASLRPKMKVLFMSGYTEASILKQGVLNHPAGFLPKPITPETLLCKVREVLDA